MGIVPWFLVENGGAKVNPRYFEPEVSRTSSACHPINSMYEKLLRLKTTHQLCVAAIDSDHAGACEFPPRRSVTAHKIGAPHNIHTRAVIQLHLKPTSKITRDLIRAGQLLKIEVLDHIVVGHGKHASLRNWVSFLAERFASMLAAAPRAS